MSAVSGWLLGSRKLDGAGWGGPLAVLLISKMLQGSVRDWEGLQSFVGDRQDSNIVSLFSSSLLQHCRHQLQGWHQPCTSLLACSVLMCIC